MLEKMTSPVACSLIYLCKCAVNRDVPDREVLKSTDLDELYGLASRHMLAAITGIALQSAGIETEKFKNAISASFWKTMILNEERASVCDKLNEAGIWYLPLKGAIIKDWYPEFGMRESADCDILFDKRYEDRVRDIMLDLGYTVERYGGGHHDVYFKQPVTNMQMHVDLFGNGYADNLNSYFANVGDRLITKSGYEMAFQPEDFYIYMISHEWEHFQKSGTGLRSVLDTYVFLQHYDETLNWDYISEEINSIGIRDFEARNRVLAQRLFGPEDLTDRDLDLLEYLVSSGVHGTYSNRVHNDVQKLGGGFFGTVRYLISRIFMPSDMVLRKYGFFARHRILLPLLPIYRLVRSFARGNIQTELRVLKDKKKKNGRQGT